ncbi:MAG: hypothetical protein ACOCP8_05200 [archaeon]
MNKINVEDNKIENNKIMIEDDTVKIIKVEKTFKVGDKVKIVKNIDLYPDALIKKGTTGEIVEVIQEGDLLLTIKLDQEYEGLSNWDNKLQIRNEENVSNTIEKVEKI